MVSELIDGKIKIGKVHARKINHRLSIYRAKLKQLGKTEELKARGMKWILCMFKISY